MATMIQESMDSEYDDVRFPQERTQGLILGLTLEQVIVVLAGVLIGMAFIPVSYTHLTLPTKA